MEVWKAPSLLDSLVRPLATAFHDLLKLVRGRQPRHGAHALALTPEHRIILVRLRYAPGWRLPGGGRAKEEDINEAVLRELREEVGMTSHGTVRAAGPNLPELRIVEDVRYRAPRWSWEVEGVMEANIENLPADLSPRSTAWIDALRDKL